MLFNAVFRACRSADLFRSRKPMDVFCSVVEEVGELATELAVAGGGSYKEEGPDGVLGEIIDVISSVTDLAFVTDHQLTEFVLLERMCPKLDKWLGKLAGVRCSVFVDSLDGTINSGLGEASFESIFDSCVRDKLAEWLNYCNDLEKEKHGLKSGLKYFDEDDIRRLNALRDSGEFWLPGMGIGGKIPEDVNLDGPVDLTVDKAECGNEKSYSGPSIMIDVRGLQAFEALKKIKDAGAVSADTDVIFDYRQLNDLVADKSNAAAIGAEIGAAITANWKALFEAAADGSKHGLPLSNDAVANVKMDVSVTLPADEIVLNIVPDQHIVNYDASVIGCLVNEQDFLDAAKCVSGERGPVVEVEAPTAYDPLIGDTGTTMVSVPSADDQTFYGQMRRMSQKAMDEVTEEENKKAWGALLEASGPVRMLFLELALGARFRYIVDGVPSDRVWIKLSDFSSRGEKIGLVAEYDSKYITHRNWVGQSVCCAEDTEAKCESLVVELVG